MKSFRSLRSRDSSELNLPPKRCSRPVSIKMKRGNEEGMPTVCMESQAMGTPIVAFNTGGVSEAVVHKETGILVAEKNTVQLSEALITLLESNQLREKFSQASIARVDKHFNVHHQCEKLENLYLNLL